MELGLGGGVLGPPTGGCCWFRDRSCLFAQSHTSPVWRASRQEVDFRCLQAGFSPCPSCGFTH